MQNLHLLERFLAVAEAGSIGKAAKRLRITSPSLTKSIQSLEQSLGSELFERHTRGVSVSPFGERLLAHVRVIDREIRFAEAEVNAFKDGLRGVLRIGAIPVWGYDLLPPAIARMHNTYPEVRVDLSIGTLSTLLPQIQAGHIDVLAGADAASIEDLPPFLEKREGPNIGIHLVAGSGHPCHDFEPGFDLSKLLQFPWVMFGNDIDNLGAFNRRVEELTGGVPRVSMTSQSLMAIAKILESGNYITWMADPVLRFLGAENVRRISIGVPFLEIKSAMVFRRSLNGVASFNLLSRHCLP